jgi:hypothetical protein
LRLKAARWVTRSGLWEIVFRIRLSNALRHFVSRFDPEVIYAPGYLLGMSQLPLLLHAWRQTPICFHTADDWPAYLYAESPARPLMRPAVRRISTRLIREAELRIAFTSLMKREYESRYQAPFHDVIGPVADMTACGSAEPVVSCPGKTLSIVYAGSLQVGRWRPAIDMAKAVQILRKERFDIVFVCYSLDTPRGAKRELEELGAILRAPVPLDQLPGVLRGAGILFLPELFNETASSRIALSLSSKVPFYLAAGRPIIVYGPPFAGVVRHAQQEGWGATVVRPGPAQLAKCLRRTLSKGLDRVHSQAILSQYDAEDARRRLLQGLRAVVRARPCQATRAATCHSGQERILSGKP